MRIPATFALLFVVCALALFVGDARPTRAASPGRDGAIAFADLKANGLATMSDTGARRQTIADNVAGYSASWSLDGKQIVFVRAEEVWVMNGDGSNQHMVIAGKTPSWTPDFRLLITTSDQDIALVSLAGQTIANLTNTASVSESDPVISPDGTMIAFSSNEDPAEADPSHPTAGGTSNLWIMDANGGNRHILWEDDAGHYGGGPDWAPDSRRVAFVDNGDIWTTPPDGNNQTNVTNDAPQQFYPAWSPDGSLIAYSETTGPGATDTSQIWTIDVNTRQRANLTNDAHAEDWAPSWQPWLTRNGRLVFETFVGNAMAIGASDVDGSHRAILFKQEGVIDPAWSPDGTKIALAVDGGTLVTDATGHNHVGAVQGIQPAWFPDSRRLITSMNDDLFVTDSARFNATPVNITKTGNGVTETDSAVSPDGKWIAYSSNESPGSDPNNPTRATNFDLYLTDPDGITRMPIVQSSTYQGSPSWSPDGKRVAYADGGDVWTVDPFNPIDRVNLTSDSLFQANPAWSPDGKLIAFGQSNGINGRSQIWTIDVGSKQRRRITQDPGNNDDSQPTWQPLFAPGSNDYFVWGDNRCSGTPDPADLLSPLYLMAGLHAPHIPGCPWIGESGLTSSNVQTTWGNLDCLGGIDAADLIIELRYIIELPVNAVPQSGSGPATGCPKIDDYIQWIPLGAPQ